MQQAQPAPGNEHLSLTVHFSLVSLTHFFIVGLMMILQQEKKPYQHLYFKFLKRSGRDVRIGTAKELNRIFKNSINQKYGGWISRLSTENAMEMSYEVHLFSRSDDLSLDLKFAPLWRFMNDVLEVSPEVVELGVMADDVDDQFKERFIVEFSDDQPSDWSQKRDNWDMDSVFSAESADQLA
jgi:hypothetical protein